MSRRSLRSTIVLTAAVAGVVVALGGPGARAFAGASPDDWTNFHHDALHSGVSPDTTIGATATAAGLHRAWWTYGGGGSKGHGPIQSSPAVVYNSTLGKTLVYVTTSSVPSQLDAIDAATGTIVWQFSLNTAGIQSSPAVFDGTVYFGGLDHNLYAVNATTGALDCSFNAIGKIDASPVVGVVDGTGPVVFFGDNGLSEKNNGGHEWAVNGVGNTNGACTEKWMFNSWNNTDGGNRTGTWSSPALATDSTGRPLVVFGSANPDDSVYALDARSGTEVWRFQTLMTSGDQDVGAPPTISAPGVNGFADGVVYINGKDKIEYAIDLLTGSEIWSFNMSADSGVLFNSVSGTCLVGDEVVVSYGQYTYALNAETGAKVWRSPETATYLLASPAVSGGSDDQVVFEGDLSGTEYAYSMADGSLLYTFSVGPHAKVVSSAAVSDGMVFFGSTVGKVFALAP